MKTVDFILNHLADLGNENAMDAQCSSVLFSRGAFYSYGYHYPLIFSVDGVVFVNTRGYSMTTAKHISWSMTALHRHGRAYCSVALPGQSIPSRSRMIELLERERLRLFDALAMVSERARVKRSQLESAMSRVNSNLEAIGAPILGIIALERKYAEEIAEQARQDAAFRARMEIRNASLVAA